MARPDARRRAAALGVAAWLWAAGLAPAGAQLLSPGQLAAPHAELEGMANCTKCHVLGSQVQPERCLACHEALAARVRAGQGFHKDKATDCVKCHADHLGRDYDMVRWDRDRFDHAETGFVLEGGHAGLKCEQCHRGTAPGATGPHAGSFLGQATDCAGCHLDEHRGQLGTTCTDCHTTAAWQPAAGFVHTRARFQLVGRHADVACARCHATETAAAVFDSSRAAADSSFVRYRELAFGACSDCHRDVHEGQFAAAGVTDCAGCHAETGWQPAAGFDHDRARFRLTGGHRRVACDACHRRAPGVDGNPGLQRFRPLAFGRCDACHADAHHGQFPGRDCAACHVDAAWKLARLDHDTTRFPLRGRHEPVACGKCHRQEELAAGVTATRFRPVAFERCADCHEDVHKGQFGSRDCAACHTVSGWKTAADFDHDKARFALRGAHVRVGCDKCHGGGASGEPARFRPVAHERCDDCHADYHDGQFADTAGGAAADCAACHVDAGWKPAARFDHGRARYALDGAHLQVACDACHTAYTTAAGESRRRYRPLQTDCAACHR